MKAFDTVSHKHYIFKQRCIGVAEIIFMWIESRLQKWVQSTMVNNYKWFRCRAGVPQLSVLGQMFNIFINNTDVGMKSAISAFAIEAMLWRGNTFSTRCNHITGGSRPHEGMGLDLVE